MSKLVVFDDKHFNSNGLVELIRGDDISLRARVVEFLRSGSRVVQLGNEGITAATAFFKGQDSTVVSSIVDLGQCEHFQIELPASGSELLRLDNIGTDMYLTVENNNQDISTIFSRAQSIGVYDRSFDRL